MHRSLKMFDVQMTGVDWICNSWVFSSPPHAVDVSKLYSEGMAILSYCSENAPNSFLVNVSFEYSSVCVLQAGLAKFFFDLMVTNEKECCITVVKNKFQNK